MIMMLIGIENGELIMYLKLSVISIYFWLIITIFKETSNKIKLIKLYWDRNFFVRVPYITYIFDLLKLIFLK